MFAFFDYLTSFFENIGSFIMNSINSMLTAFEVLISIQFVPTIFNGGVIPAIIASSMIIVMTIGIIKLVLGWGNS